MKMFVRAHRVASSLAAMVALGLVVFVLLWFQPQKILIEKTVKEPAPAPSASASARVLGTGSFRSLEHRTAGSIHLIRLADGSVFVRIEDLDTSNGPDLRVYISKHPPDLGWHAYGDGYVDLGALKGNRGDQNYRVPAKVDVRDYRSVVIWCRRFKVGFGVAPIGS